MKHSILLRTLLMLAAVLLAGPAHGRGLTADDLVSLRRLSDPQVSPDGSRVAFQLRETDLAANRGRTDLYLLDLRDPDAAPQRLTQHEANDGAPQWNADGDSIYFVSSRADSDQIWRIAIDGGEPVQVTDYPVDVANPLMSPDGRRLAFTARVFADCASLACTAERLREGRQAPHSARLYDKLFVRHWGDWKDGRRSALFTVALAEDGSVRGDPVQVSRGQDGDVPSVPFGEREELAFSADGATLYFVLREAGRAEPWSTDLDVYAVPADGSAPPRNLTAANDATDTQPIVSPDGALLAWKAMARPGYESDQFDLMVRDLEAGTTRNLTGHWDRSIGAMRFAPNGRHVYVTARDTGATRIFRIAVADGSVEPLTGGHAASGLAIAGDRLIYVRESFGAPADLYALAPGGDGPVRLTDVNADQLADVEVAGYEQFRFAGADGDSVHGYVMRPAGFQEGRRYPVAFLIHGGPQSSFGEGFSYRWNPQTYAAQGYGVVMIDFHGSRGYGQDFVDSIRGDWGGKPLHDLRAGLAAATAQFRWLDADRVCALGASYGGYMVNWIAGKWPERFRCLVNHDGLFDLRSFYYATEELWFPEWDFGGPYHAAEESFERWNPVHHVEAWQTPMLVIHGEKDFRVPLEQGLAAFTALQRQGVESKLLIFPDEHHWVLKPANSLEWHRTVEAWLARYLKRQDEG